jgi:hypothetical protein
MELDITQPCRYSITTFTPPLPSGKRPTGMHSLNEAKSALDFKNPTSKQKYQTSDIILN